MEEMRENRYSANEFSFTVDLGCKGYGYKGQSIMKETFLGLNSEHQR